jgi:hypothetical protein
VRRAPVRADGVSVRTELGVDSAQTTPLFKPDREIFEEYDPKSHTWVRKSVNNSIESGVGHDIRKAWQAKRWMSVAGNTFVLFIVNPIGNTIIGLFMTLWHLGEGIVTLNPVRALRRIGADIYRPIKGIENGIDGIRGYNKRNHKNLPAID